MLAGPAVRAAGPYLQVFVRAPYLELHTGPGRGYPVFNVVDRDASVDVLKRYTDWFKVRSPSGVEGWASAQDMEQTVLADGTHFHYDVGDQDGFTSHRFEAGAFLYGDYGGASAISVYGAVFANPRIASHVPLHGSDEVVRVRIDPTEVFSQVWIGLELLAGQAAVVVLVVHREDGLKGRHVRLGAA